MIHHVTSPDRVPALIPGPTLYIDIETYGVEPHDALDLLTNQIRLVSMCGEGDIAYVFDLFHLRVSDIAHLFRRDAEWCGHNLAFDLAALHRAGIPYPSKCFDTLVCSQVLMNGLDPAVHGGHRLAECMHRYCEVELVKEYGDSDWSATQLSPEQIEYSGNDVLCLRQLRDNLVTRLGVRQLTKVAELECDIVPALVEMTLNGIQVDREQWHRRSLEAEEGVVHVKGKLDDTFPPPDPEPYKTVRTKRNGDPFAADVAYNARVDEKNKDRRWNWASWQQILTVFARESVYLDNTAYETLVEKQDVHPGVKLLLDFKDVEKEATTFGRDWLKHLRNERGPDRVHPTWRQLGAETGRMSCAHPNLQQIPRKKVVRKGITASPGRLLVRADFSQIEARIAAKISRDPTLCRLFIENTGDIHKFTAGRVLGKAENEVTADDRQIGKSLLFGLLFGMGAEKLLVYCRTNYGVTLTPEQAKEFRERFFGVFPGLRAWHKRVGSDCDGKTDFRTLLGRRRLIMTPGSKFTEALNTPVQGTGVDLLKLSVREMWKERDQWPGANLIALIHDEIMFDVVEADAERFGRRLREKMVEVGNQILDPIPVDSEVKIARTWGG